MKLQAKIIKLILVFFHIGIFVNISQAEIPIGCLDAANANHIGGWALDPDYSGPIWVHIYVNGKFAYATLADKHRDDVGDHAFGNDSPPFGSGAHEVRAYAINVDSQGNLEGGHPQLSNSPITYNRSAREYSILRPNGNIMVVFDAKFGGAITKIYDYPNMGSSKNLVDDNNGGTMFQPAFWLLPEHDTPVGCPQNEPSFRFDNPTLAGFYGDGLAGNPINFLGTSSAADENEFIHYHYGAGGNIYEQLHFKSGFIRYDYSFGSWSSQSRTTSVLPPSSPEWCAFWFGGFYNVDYIKLQPWLKDGEPRCVPERIEIYYSNPETGNWSFIKVVDLPSYIAPTGHTITFDQKFTNGILIRTFNLRSDDGEYYFRMAETKAGLASEGGEGCPRTQTASSSKLDDYYWDDRNLIDNSDGGAPIRRRADWDTDFYLEQIAYFHPNHADTLVIENTLHFVGTSPRSVSTRQLPIIFANHLPRVAFWENNIKKIQQNISETSINPDKAWAALIADDKEAGIGMACKSTLASCVSGYGKFAYAYLGSGVTGDPLSVLFPSYRGVPNLASMGTLTNVEYLGAWNYRFNPGGMFEWTMYYPIGTLSHIKNVGDQLP